MSASILIVDDDRSIVRLCQRVLERAAYEVIASTDPLEALRILESNKVDLLLSDIRMPVMDGFELIEKGKNLQPELAVLVMTGFGTVDTAVQALYKGVDGLILKPFENTGDLVQAVQRVLVDRRQKQDAARAQALRPLFDVSETLLSETSLENLEKLILDVITSTFKADVAGVYCKTADPDQPRLVAGKEFVGSWSIPLRQIITQSTTPSLHNLSASGDAEIQPFLRDLGWSSLMIAPVIRGSGGFVFYVSRRSDGAPFNETDIELFGILGRQSVVAMENAQLYTDLKEYVHKVEESQRALVQAEKMAAVGRLMASLAHEINNPLQAVRNCLHLAMRTDIDDSQRSNYLSMTVSEVDRLVGTVRRMLDFYRPGKVEKEIIDLSGIIERVTYLLQSQMTTQRIKTHIHISEDTPMVLGVKDQIQQVVFNLLLNSMDAMDTIHDKNIWMESSQNGDDLVLDIEDSGSGVPVEMRDHLFEPFNSSKKNGTGLGLTVSYGVIEAHGGSLELVEGRHGHGACFEIRLPIAKEG
jgi:signal transduction histidine kinase/CheY-like chemotaxis protein